MLVAFFSTLKLIPAKQRLSLLTQKNHVGIRANDSKSKYRDTVLSIHFYFHLRISENTAKQIITAFHFCVFPKLLHHNATQMPVGLGYLLKAKQCLWSPRTCLWTQMKKNCCTVSISLYKPRNSKVYDRAQYCSLSKWLQNYFLILDP